MDLAVQALQLDASDFINKSIAAEALLVAVERAKQRYTSRKKLQDYTAYLEAGWAETNQELQQMAYQARILHQDKMMSLGRLAASVAHEINNPLSGPRLQLSNIEIKIDAGELLPLIRGDANQLQQWLINLVFNAIDAMPEGGLLEISARAEALKKHKGHRGKAARDLGMDRTTLLWRKMKRLGVDELIKY